VQVTDAWLVDAATGRTRHVPDMPAAVELKATSMRWVGDRVVWLASVHQRDLIAVWRPGDAQLSVRSVRLPARDSGSDSFVAWTGSAG
jgi:hypothetical protein